MFSEKRQKILMLSIFVMLLVVSLQLWLAMIHRDEVMRLERGLETADSASWLPAAGLGSAENARLKKLWQDYRASELERRILENRLWIEARSKPREPHLEEGSGHLLPSPSTEKVPAHSTAEHPSFVSDSLPYRLISIAHTASGFKVQLRTPSGQEYQLVQGEELPGLGRVQEVQRDRVIFQSKTTKTSIGFFEYSQSVLK